MTKLHCDYRCGTPGACQRREGNRFYLVNGVQRPLCDEHAAKLGERNQVFALAAEASS